MMFKISIPVDWLKRVVGWLDRLPLQRIIIVLAVLLAVGATVWSFFSGYVIAYGDSESHLNIAKRVVDSITPGFAQLGGIWLPLPHLVMVPLVHIDWLWRTGLAGSIISGISFVISSVYIYKLTLLITKNKWAGFAAAAVFMSNPNILYLQSTPMTELILIMFFVLSGFYFTRFIENTNDKVALMLAAVYAFAASLSRYDGWFLVGIEMGIIGLLYFPWTKIPRSLREITDGFKSERWQKMEGYVILFSTVAYFGILLWLLWDFLILGDPLYFTHSEFSAASQQQEWLGRGQLPSYGHIVSSFWYYFMTTLSNVGVLVTGIAVVGFFQYLFSNKDKKRFYVMLLLMVPFIFNVLTLYLGQSVIFLPHLTPIGFDWNLFNVRYGVMMVPMAAFVVAYVLHKAQWPGRVLVVCLLFAQLGLYGIGYSKVISLEDGRAGLSSQIAKLPDAQVWIQDNYDDGLVLVDDFARTISIVRTDIPMENIIYVGNKPYWPESLEQPEKYAKWIIMQQNDDLWQAIYENQPVQDRMYKYFNKVYTSPEILIFKRNPDVPAEN